MSTRTLIVIAAGLVLILSLSYLARDFVRHMRCDGLGMIYEEGRGCVEPARAPPIILERGLKRA